jgi:carbon storage regulator
MLVLTRRTGERVRIGEDVEVVIVSVRGDQVRLGIAAPRRIAVSRAELLEQVRDENRAAARGASRSLRRGDATTPLRSPGRSPLSPCRIGTLKREARGADTKNGDH